MGQYTQSVQEETHSGAALVNANYSAVQTDASLIATPGSHKSIYITDLIVSNGDTAGYIFLEQAPSGGVASIIVNRLNLAVNGPLVTNFAQALQLTPNSALTITSSTTDDFSITANYYIDEVKGFGYSSGGHTGGALSNVIDENYFSSDSNSTDVGNLTVARQSSAGQSSTVSGYNSGGSTGSNSNVIDKFSFASDGDATDVGDLTVARYSPAGQQH